MLYILATLYLIVHAVSLAVNREFYNMVFCGHISRVVTNLTPQVVIPYENESQQSIHDECVSNNHAYTRIPKSRIE